MCVSILITTDVRYLVKESSREREIKYSVKKGQGKLEEKNYIQRGLERWVQKAMQGGTTNPYGNLLL